MHKGECGLQVNANHTSRGPEKILRREDLNVDEKSVTIETN